MSEDRKAFITASNDEVWNQGNIDAAARLFAPNIVRHQPPMPERGRPGRSDTGRKVVIQGAGIWRWEDGRVVEDWTYNDYLGLMQQLGMIPSS